MKKGLDDVMDHLKNTRETYCKRQEDLKQEKSKDQDKEKSKV
jgi:hypothetical protein